MKKALFALLLILSLCSLNEAGASEALDIKDSASCSRKVFERSANGHSWIVFSCNRDGYDNTSAKTFFRIEYSDASATFRSLSLTEADTDDITQVRYGLISNQTLLLDMQNDGGGRVILVHPIRAKNMLSHVEGSYEGDEVKFKEENGIIYSVSPKKGIDFTVGADGTLKEQGVSDGAARDFVTTCSQAKKVGNLSENYKLTVTKGGDTITALTYSASMDTGEEGNVASCDVNTLGPGISAIFTHLGNITDVDVKDKFGGNLKVELTDTGRGFVAIFKGGAAFCGLGWGFPAKLVYTSEGKCMVTR